MSRESLKGNLKKLAGLSPWTTIDDAVLSPILNDLQQLLKSRTQTGRLTGAMVREIVAKYVPNTGTYGYLGEDMSDLNALLVALQNQSGGGTTRTK